MYKPKERDLQYARLALIERMATPAQVQKAMGLLRKITEAGGSAPPIGEVLVGQGTITAGQNEGLLKRLTEVEGAIADAQGGLHEVPRRVGAYEISERIGRGGMGAVYKARQLHMDRTVALKILAAHLTRDQKYIRQFVREARAAGQISHPNVVSVHEVGQAGAHFFICMEYVEGRPLSRELLAKRRLEPPEVLRIGALVASALVAAEKHGIVHRDIKPDNILITPRGDIKVTDLGLAKRLSDVTSAGQTGWGCGTPYYMAPEQARNSSAVDIRADIYALGATMYHLVTGKLPFDAPSSVEVLMRAANERLTPPTAVRPDVPAGLSDLIERMMSKDPEDRPRTAAQLLAQIEAVRRSPGRPAIPRPSAARRPAARAGAGRNKSGSSAVVLAVAWSAALLAAAAAVYLAVADRRPAFREAPGLPEEYRTAKASGNGDGNGGTAEPVDTAGEAAARAAMVAARRAAASGEVAGMTAALLMCDDRMGAAGRLRAALEEARGLVLARLELLAGQDLDRRRWLANQAIRHGRLGEAAGVLDEFDSAWPGTAAAEALAAERRALDERIVAAAGELRRRFAELLEAERFDRAGELLTRAGGGGLESSRAWVESASRQLDAARTKSERDLQALREEVRRTSALLRDARERMARWDFRDAARKIEEIASELPAGARASDMAALALARARTLQAFLDDLVARVKAADPPIEDRVFRRQPEGLVVREAYPGGLLLGMRDGKGPESILPWPVLSAAERLRLARHVADRRGSDEQQLGMALLCITAGLTDEAERYLDVAAREPATRERALMHRRELQLLATEDEETAAARLEAAAREHLEAAEAARAVGEIGTLLGLHGRTARVGTRLNVVTALLREASRECALAAPLSGRCREVLPGVLRAEYAFHQESSAGDWSPPPDLRWLHEATAGDVLVSIDLDGQADSTVLTLEPRVGTGRRAPAGLRLLLTGPLRGDEALKDLGPRTGAVRQDRMELRVAGDRLFWSTPSGAGVSALPEEVLSALTRGEVEGWKIGIAVPPDGPRLTSAALEFGFSERAARAAQAARREAAQAALARARALPESWMQARDLERVAESFRDVPEAAAAAELSRCRALLDDRREGDARAVAGRLLALYGDRPEVAAAVQALLKGTGAAGG